MLISTFSKASFVIETSLLEVKNRNCKLLQFWDNRILNNSDASFSLSLFLSPKTIQDKRDVTWYFRIPRALKFATLRFWIWRVEQGPTLFAVRKTAYLSADYWIRSDDAAPVSSRKPSACRSIMRPRFPCTTTRADQRQQWPDDGLNFIEFIRRYVHERLQTVAA